MPAQSTTCVIPQDKDGNSIAITVLPETQADGEGAYLIIQNQSNNYLMWTYDGTEASETNGFKLPVSDDPYEWPNHNVPTDAISVWGPVPGQQIHVARG